MRRKKLVLLKWVPYVAGKNGAADSLALAIPPYWKRDHHLLTWSKSSVSTILKAGAIDQQIKHTFCSIRSAILELGSKSLKRYYFFCKNGEFRFFLKRDGPLRIGTEWTFYYFPISGRQAVTDVLAAGHGGAVIHRNGRTPRWKREGSRRHGDQRMVAKRQWHNTYKVFFNQHSPNPTRKYFWMLFWIGLQ